jgi:hypothetical protein
MMAGKFKGDFETAINGCAPGMIAKMETVEGVDVLARGAVLKQVYAKAGFTYDEYIFAPYTQQISVIKAWAARWGCHLYSRGREDFFIGEAVEEAIAAGHSRVAVEDLS